MFRVTKTFRFEAAHQLPEHDGKCKDLHGHSYRVEVSVMADGLADSGPKNGMVLDFGEVKAAWEKTCAGWDHAYLNGVVELQPPTAEKIAFEIWARMSAALPGRKVANVKVWETDDSCAEYIDL